jgi:hypothetical protein
LDRNGNPFSGPGVPQTVTVGITAACPHTFFFGESSECVQADAVDLQSAFQPFEGGYMIWRSDRRQIVVLYNDGAAQVFDDNWNGQPIITEGPPPEGRFVPERGFGWVWADQIGVHERLGWAYSSEQPYTLRWQPGYFDTPDPTPPGVSFYTWPDGTVIRIIFYEGAAEWNFV